MSLSRHVNPEEVIKHFSDTHIAEALGRSPHDESGQSHLTPYSSRYASQAEIPKFRMPSQGAPADTVYAMLRDELDLDGKPNLNLASFVGTYMEDNARQLMTDNISKNLADADEYPAMMSVSERCVSMLAHLWGVQPGEQAVGSPTTGSSEAIHLGGLAMKRRWTERRQAEGKDALRPNVVMGANAQVALEKFARYFDVEARILPVSEASSFRLDPELVRRNVDDNTIGVFVILGSTYTGHYEPVEEVSNVLDEYQEKTGIDIPIHVDGASGAFVAPFTHAQAGGPKWNFELPRVKSINTSGHKYGLVFAGIGWIIWRDESFLPKHLIFELHYLGGTEKTYTLNFTRPGAQVLAQYYNLVHLGFQGYREVMENCLSNARLLSSSLEATGWYHCVSDIHRKAAATEATKGRVAAAVASAAGVAHGHGHSHGQSQGPHRETSAEYQAGLPVVSFRFSDEFKKEYPHLKQETVSLLLRARQWIIPNYALPPDEDGTEILRVVVRESMSFDLLDRLITDIIDVTQTIMEDDQIDLSVLQKQGRPGMRKGKDEDKKGPSRGEELSKKVKGVADGIHRTVC